MSEPIGVEERARLREHYSRKSDTESHTICALLREVDRLTEALERERGFYVAMDVQCQRAEADLADEKRRRAEIWDEGAERGFDSHAPEDLTDVQADNPYRALLDTATEETPGAP